MSTPTQPTGRRPGRFLRAGLATALLVIAVVVAIHPSLLGGPRAWGAAASDSRPPVTVLHPADRGAAPAVAEPGTRVVRALPADGKKYFGVSVAHLSTGSDPSAEFTAAVGAAPTLQMFFGSFADTFDVTAARRITAAGRLPMLTWEPFDEADRHADAFPLAAIAAGKYDTYLRDQAALFASVDGPLVIRFAHEMNGNWYPWGVGVPGNSPAAYVAAYRHVHDVVTAAGAKNVVWMWAPNLIDAAPRLALASLYPGDAYVDWVGLSGYFTTPADTFTARFSRTLAQVNQVAPTKPILLAETAVERTANRAAQIGDLVAGVTRTPRFIGLVWFDVAKRADWAVDDDPGAAAALGAAVSGGGFGATPETVTVSDRTSTP